MRKFGMLFQGGALFDSLTVWENITFALLQEPADYQGPGQGAGGGETSRR